jgi:hypothetical protein
MNTTTVSGNFSIISISYAPRCNQRWGFAYPELRLAISKTELKTVQIIFTMPK